MYTLSRIFVTVRDRLSGSQSGLKIPLTPHTFNSQHMEATLSLNQATLQTVIVDNYKYSMYLSKIACYYTVK